MAHKILQYTVLFTPDEESGGFVAEVPALPGCHTQGDSLQETKKNIQEAIVLTLETLAERHLAFPEDVEPNFFKSKVTVDIDRIPA